MAIRIRIGAALDPEARNVFVPFVQAAERARSQIARAGSQSARDFVGGYRDAPAHARRSADGVSKAIVDAAQRGTAAEQKSAKDRERAEEHVYNIKRRYMERQAREEEKGAERAFNIKQKYLEKEARAEERARTARISATRGVLTGAASTTIGAARGAVGMAGQIARGAGIELDPAAYIRRSVELEKMAANLSAASYHPGEAGPAGTRQNPQEIISQVREVADVAGVDTKAAMEGLAEFVSKTGELDTGRKMLKDLAILSQATGTNLDDMVSAAGEIASKFPEGTNKATATLNVLRALAGQGKLGAVEIRHMATQMAKIGAVSGKFGMSHEQAMVELGVITEVARARGGAGKPAEAARAAQALIQSFAKASFLKNLQKETQINPYDETGKNLRAPEELIVGILSKTAGDPRKLGRIFRDVKSGQGIGGFAEIFNRASAEAGGGKTGTEAGAAAVRAEFARLRNGTVQNQEVQESFRRRMETSEAKVQRLNNELERVAAEASAKLIPALIALAPHLVKVARSMGDLATYVAENPLKSAILVFGASITKEVAAIGIKSMFEKAIGGMGGAGGGKLGALAGTIMIATATIAIEDAILNAKEKQQEKSEELAFKGMNAITDMKAAAQSGTIAQEDLQTAKATMAELDVRVAGAEKERPGFVGGVFSGVANYVSAGSYGESFESQARREADAGKISELKSEMAELKTLMGKVANGTIKVQVTNQPATPLGQPPAGTTTGIQPPAG